MAFKRTNGRISPDDVIEPFDLSLVLTGEPVPVTFSGLVDAPPGFPRHGVAIRIGDDPAFHRGAPIHFETDEGLINIDAVVTRRYKLRNGNVKLWWERRA